MMPSMLVWLCDAMLMPMLRSKLIRNTSCSRHTVPQFIRQLVSAAVWPGLLLASGESSGWIVAECTP